jgi:hypothetical protein
VCSKDTVDVYALAWSDKKGKQIVFTTGTTLDAEPSCRRRHRRILRNGQWEKAVYEKIVPRPNVIKELFDAFSTIDIHDHLRQGSLEMEREWQTKNWVLWLFMTILGIIIVNSFNAYLYMTKSMIEQDDFNEFLGKLSYQIIHNDFQREGERKLRRREVAAQDFDDDDGPHVAALLSSLPSYSHHH